MIKLIPMPHSEILPFLRHVLEWYTQELFHTNAFSTKEQAQETAQKDISDIIAKDSIKPYDPYYFSIFDSKIHKAVGTLWCSLNTQIKEGYIRFIFIDHPMRNAGRAKAAVAQIEAFFVKRGMQTSRLQVFNSNAKARKLYQSCGFVECLPNSIQGYKVGYYMQKEL